MLTALSSLPLSPSGAPGQRPFVLALLAAFLAHIAGLVLWDAYYVPPPPPVKVKTIHIRVGTGGELTTSGEQKALEAPRFSRIAAPEVEPATNVPAAPMEEASPAPAEPEKKEAVVPKPVPEKPVAEKKVKLSAASEDKALVTTPAKKKPADVAKTEPVKKKPDTPWEIVRKDKVAAVAAGEKTVKLNDAAPLPLLLPESDGARYVREANNAGAAYGNDPEAAQVVARYEQRIALWIEQHKVYPPEAKAQGLVGNAVARIRINANGKILKYALEVETGHSILNHAAIDMIRRSDPVPPVPDNYPGAADLLEFLVPISFKLN